MSATLRTATSSRVYSIGRFNPTPPARAWPLEFDRCLDMLMRTLVVCSLDQPALKHPQRLHERTLGDRNFDAGHKLMCVIDGLGCAVFVIGILFPLNISA